MKKCRLYLVLFAVMHIFAGSVFASEVVPPQYIHGSWVNVRFQPLIDAAVVDHVVVNTAVNVLNGDAGNGFCEITYEVSKQGFVVCRLIGMKPLLLQDVGKPLTAKGEPNPSYSATRAFWLQPSVDRLMDAGKYFEKTMLKPGEFELEIKPALEGGQLGRLRRFPIPEFEAMKERLRNGVMGFREAGDDAYSTLPKWQDVRNAIQKIPSANRLSDVMYLPRWSLKASLVRALKLPQAKPSYFLSSKEIHSPVGYEITTEMASAIFNIPYIAQFKGGPKWVPEGTHDGGYLFGAWDIGDVETRLVANVNLHTLFRDGRIFSETSVVEGGRFVYTSGNECDSSGFTGGGDAGAAILRAIDSPEKPGKRLFSFYTKTSLPSLSAKVTRSKNKFRAAGFVEAEILRFDVDHDGVEDILVWEGTGISDQELSDPGSPQAYFRMMFFNIKGEWHLFLVDEFNYGC